MECKICLPKIIFISMVTIMMTYNVDKSYNICYRSFQVDILQSQVIKNFALLTAICNC